MVLKWFGRPQTCCAQEARVQSRPASLHKACIFFAFCPHFLLVFILRNQATKPIRRVRHRLAGARSGGTGRGYRGGGGLRSAPPHQHQPPPRATAISIRPSVHPAKSAAKTCGSQSVELLLSIDLSKNAPLLASTTLLRTPLLTPVWILQL